MPTHTLEAIRPAPAPDSDIDPIAGNRVELQLLTTLKCNLKCTYCSLGVGEVLGSQTELKYDIDQLAAFVEKHLAGKEIYVTFYGGEPTLNQKMMQQVMRRFPEFRYQLQTNGTLLDDLPDWMLARFSNILVSIDGGEQTTDDYRGRGIWRKVIRNLGHIHERVGGTITARVTWGNPDTSFEELDELATAIEAVDYLYWQFVADEMYGGDSLEKRKAVLVRLIDKFFSRTDTLYPLVPLMGIVRNKVLPTRGRELYAGLTQCRVSTHLVNVMPNGEIFPCPDMMYAAEMKMGEIQSNWLKKSPLQPTTSMPCEGCEAFSWCRCNCMKNLYLGYVKNDERYRRNVVEPICELVKFIGREVDRHDPHGWFSRLALSVRKQITDAEIYEYVEIMP
ncbi:radical SAM/SPASM domain-containing protein [Georgfuchsia toluolica]|uniref:radical SAM/SPASM domain-containing protein n=1 Tax=Georgfuchsia toluolica TaxID=424218 RepID=UPI001C7342F6|nr:radical SAM protein [Georgfuchsia toluolica]